MTEPFQSQLELFEAIPSSRLHRREIALVGNFRIRYDHAVLITILGLIGCSIVFAMGVERGKHLARTEQRFLGADLARYLPGQSVNTRDDGQGKTNASEPTDRHTEASKPKVTPDQKTVPRPAQGRKPPVKTVSKTATSGFVVQVVSYDQPRLAVRELQRLKGRGEPAFLLMKRGKTVVMVGPFSTKAGATTNLARLRQRYQDCFVRTL